MNIPFIKMQGCGNDYVYVDCVGEQYDIKDKSELARKISDRHFGVGSDGLIFVNKSKIADFEMEMYNADGSRGEMCGNGIRCVAKLVHDKGYVSSDEFTVESMGAVKKIKVFTEKGLVKSATVDMGEPELSPSKIPVLTDGDGNSPVIGKGITAAGLSGSFTAVSMGNPHAVIFTDELDVPAENVKELNLEAIGPSFENHDFFPERVNTEFVYVVDKKNVEMRVWERGSGETLACGTGCCAAVVACVLNNRTDRKITVHLLGGRLEVYWDESDNHVYMKGPAETVFTGVIEV